MLDGDASDDPADQVEETGVEQEEGDSPESVPTVRNVSLWG